MNRQAVRSALGRAAASHTITAPARGLPLSAPTPTTFFPISAPAASSRSFTTSSSGGSSSDNGDAGNNGSLGALNAAVQKLAQLNRTSRAKGDVPGSPADARPRSNFSNPARGGTGGVDARSLRVSLAGGGDAPAAGRVLNVRSLRGGLRGGMRGGVRDISPFGRSGGFGGGSRFGPGAAGRLGGGGGRFGGFGDGGRDGRGRGRAGALSRKKKTEKSGEDGKDKVQGKVVWTEEEQAIFDRLDKGEVVPFQPEVTVDSLAGYGAAMATDASIGQVESAMRVMRLMTGGMAFNAESGVTADLKVVQKRYLAKMPIFVHSKEEKAWIESANPRLRVAEPNDATKKAILDAAVLGHYEAHGFAELKDVKATIANYHDRTFTYMGSDAQKFTDKVLSLLPGQQGAKRPAAAQPRK